jgi:hypothetical protein
VWKPSKTNEISLKNKNIKIVNKTYGNLGGISWPGVSGRAPLWTRILLRPPTEDSRGGLQRRIPFARPPKKVFFQLEMQSAKLSQYKLARCSVETFKHQ